MIQKLTKQELNFLFNTLIPLNIDRVSDIEYKSKLQLFVNAHNPEKFIFLDDKLKEENLTKEEHFEKSFKDTINYFFIEQKTKKQKKYFSRADLYKFKDDFLYLFKFNSFYHFEKYTIAVQLYHFLQHLSETFQSLEYHSRNKKLSRGTAFMTSSYRDGLEADLNFVRKQLNEKQAFSHVTKFDKERLKVSKFSIKAFRNHTDIANFFITLNGMYKLEKFKLDATDGERAGLKQAFTHLNGLKTSQREIIQSFMIKAYFPYYKKATINKSKLARIVHQIAENFFPEHVYLKETNRKDKNGKNISSYTIGLTPKVFNYKTYIKTALNENTIYAYDHKNEYTWLMKGTVKDTLNFIKKMYLDDGLDEVVNHPLFDKVIKKLIQSPIYPL